MDTTELRRAVDDLAASLSEITVGDFELRAGDGTSLADLYQRILERSAAGLGLRPPPRAALLASVDCYGAGFERAYRRTAARGVEALDDPTAIAALLAETLAWTAEIDRVLALD